MKIGNIELVTPIAAAPLAGISDPVYREMMHAYGAGLVVSEMISDKALHYRNQQTIDMCRVTEHEHPVALQIFGSDPETMGEAAEFLTANTACDIIDINMGCPVAKVLKAHSGSYLMQYPELASDIVKAVVEHTDKPVTVKIRAGWDHQHINCDTFAKKMEDAGVSAIAIHGRTRSQMYEGNSDNTYIRMVKENVSVPVFGNGDIRTVEDARRMFEETGCDGIMIGRGLLGRPFFLKELNAWLNHEEYTEPAVHERINLCLGHARRLCDYEGEFMGIRRMRGLAPWYIAGLPYSARIRHEMTMITSYEELVSLLEQFEQRIKEVMYEEV